MLRFGITLTNYLFFDLVGLNFFDLSYESIFKPLLKTGFHHIEFPSNLSYIIPSLQNLDKITYLKAFLDENEISLSVHCPDYSLELATPNISVRRGSIESVVNMYNLTKYLEPEIMVLHVTGAFASSTADLAFTKGRKKHLLREIIFENARTSLSEILDETGAPPSFFAIENVNFPHDLTFELVKEFHTSLCLDSGHLAAFPKWMNESLDYLECFKRMYPYLKEVHLNDGGFFPDEKGNIIPNDHKTLGEGVVPYLEIVEYLYNQKFTGPIIFELSVTEALDSLRKLKNELPKLFKSPLLEVPMAKI